jgi:hypothetical protein
VAIETSVILTVSREEAAPDVFVCVTFGSDAVAHHIGGEDGITARRCDAAVLESVARSYPEAEFLLLVEHPARALARDGNSEWCASPVALLNAWNDSAARMLRHLRTCRTRTIVLSLDELEALGVHRDEYLARIRAWLPIVLPARPGVIGPSHHEDALVSLLARRVVREDSNAEDLHAELVMACEPVPPDWSLPGPIQRQHDTIDAAALLASWSQSVAKVEQLRSESEALRRELRAAQERLKAEHQTSMERQAAASSASQKVIGRYKAELAAVLAQLHQTQEELERQFLTQQAAATARATELAQLQRELGEAASVAERAQEELERQFLTQQAAATARATELAQLQRELSEAASVAERARRERRTLEAEALGHLLQVKAIDDNAAARLLRLDDDAAAARVGRIVIGTAHDGAEHRHLEFELRDARGLRGPLARLRLRLLEHRGHAGLALLCGVGEIEPIGAWETHGQEGDDRFCLLLPGDQASRGVWQRLSAADWRFLLTIVVQLDGQLSQSTLPLAPFWRGIARPRDFGTTASKFSAMSPPKDARQCALNSAEPCLAGASSARLCCAGGLAHRFTTIRCILQSAWRISVR